MAEFLWTFAAQELLKKTVKLAAEQIGLAWGFKNELSKLRDSLLMVEAILRDVDRIKAEHQAVKLWAEKLEDIVFEADVLLDELAYEDLRRKVEPQKENTQNLSSLSITEFRKLPEGLAQVHKLKSLIVHGYLEGYDWSPLVHLGSLKNLVLVDLEGSGAIQLPQQLEQLTSLRSLHISHFDGVEALPEWFGNFTSLEILKLYNCVKLKNMPSKEAMSNLTRLKSLRVYGCPQLELNEGDFERVKISHVPTNN